MDKKDENIVFSFIHQILFITLMLLSISLIIMDKTSPQKTLIIRTAVIDTVAPILDVISSPIRGYRILMSDFNSNNQLKTQNKRLESENSRLRKILNIAAKLKIENDKLRDMVSLLPDKNMSYVTARVVATAFGDGGGNVIINSGASAGLKNGQIAVTKHGLVGRLSDVGKNSARVIFITDAKSKVPVMVAKATIKAVLVGSKSGNMSLKYISNTKKLKVGDNIVTSGDGKFFPNGINIGSISAINGNKIKVKSDVDFANLEYVSIAI